MLRMVPVLLVLAGCESTHYPAPVIERTPPAARPAPAPASAHRAPDQRPDVYTIKKGDTLYTIALDYGLDFKELAEWNNITNRNAIQVGQQLRLKPPPSTVVTAPLKTAPQAEARPLGSALPAPAAPAGDAVKSQPKAIKVPYSDQAYAQLSAAAPIKTVVSIPAKVEARTDEKPAAGDEDDEKIDWGWPANGKLLGAFTEYTNLKGINITGKPGQPVFASAAGKVIYSGTGIRGLGKFIIIKHSKAYLSVYANNSELLVKYGQMVAKGEKIAEMGNTDADQVGLHFEIRRFGKPVDPIKLLPDQPPA